MYDLINAGVWFVTILFQGYCLQYYYGSFLESRERAGKWTGSGVIVLYVGSQLCLRRILPSEYGEIRTVGKQMINLIFLVILALVFYRAARAIICFLIITFMAICEISIFCAVSLQSIAYPLYDFWAWCIEKEYISLDALEFLIEITFVSTDVLLCVTAIIIPAVSFTKIVRSFREKGYAIDRTELLFILAPGIAGLLICVLVEIFMFAGNGVNYQDSYLLIFLVPAIMLLSLLSILYDVQLFQDMIDRNREKNSRAILEKQLSAMQEQIAEMEHIHSGIRSMKHDMKNTLAVIGRLADQSGNADTENTELQVYLSEINRTFDNLELRFQTGNTVVDTLLNMKYHDIMRTAPDLQMDADHLLFPEDLMIQSYDIGIILGNALDNAIEACKKRKAGKQGAETFIRLYSFSKRNMFFIKVENSFDGEVIHRKGAEFPATTKPDKKVHGIGLTNIKNTAEKYHGGVDWSADHTVFTLLVMLKNEKGI